MATETQKKYIADLVVIKTKEFKEVKELLVASEIVKDSSETVMKAETIAEITNAMDDAQASRFIDLLINTKEPKRGTKYADRRVENTVAMLDSIKSTINNWDFS